MFAIRLALRPLRVGFVVKHGDLDGLWKAVRFNTCLWGGLFNPIIPVRGIDLLKERQPAVDDPPPAEDLVRTFDVDLLHNVSASNETGTFVEVHDHLTWPREPSLVSDEGTEHEHLTLLDVMPALNGLPEDTSLEESRWAIHMPPLEGWPANLVRLMGGDPDGSELGRTALRHPYADRLRPSGLVFGEGVPLHMHLTTARWPIHLSTLGLEKFRLRHGWSNPGVFLGDVTDFDDLVEFWNLRAAGNDVMFFPTQAMTDARPLARAHLERVGERRADPWDGPAIWHLRDRPDAALIERAKELLGDLRLQPCGGAVWNGLNIKPVRVARDWDTAVAHVRSTYAESAWLDVQLLRLAFDRALLGRWNRWQHVALDVDAHDFHVGDERLTLKVPPLRRMNTFLDSGHAGVRVKRGHLSLFTDAERSVFPLSASSFRAVLREVLAHSGFQIKDSVPGKYSRRIVELMGGVSGCRVLKLPGVRRLLRDPAARRGIEAEPARQIIANRDPHTGKTDFIDLGIFFERKRATPDVVLRHLVKQGVLRPGVSLECPSCGESTWYATTRLRKRALCACCGAASGTEARLGDGLRLQFRVAPIWVKAVQFGVIPVILALWRLEEQHGLGSARYLTSVEVIGGGVEMEVDFLGLIEEPDKRPMLLVGECKTTRETEPEKLRAKIGKLKAWYDAVERTEMKACIAFVTTEPAFDSALLAECESMVREERRVLLFTARELDPYLAYAGAEDVPRKHPIAMWELCANGVARYLPDVWKEQQETRPETQWRRVKPERDAPT